MKGCYGGTITLIFLRWLWSKATELNPTEPYHPTYVAKGKTHVKGIYGRTIEIMQPQDYPSLEDLSTLWIMGWELQHQRLCFMSVWSQLCHVKAWWCQASSLISLGRVGAVACLGWLFWRISYMWVQRWSVILIVPRKTNHDFLRETHRE